MRRAEIELTPEERIAFVKILDEWHGAMKHFLASCVAKPVPQPMMSEVQRLDLERKRLGLRRIGNGSQR
jgi:hypothetical protein